MAEQKLMWKVEPSNNPQQTEAQGHKHTTGNECHNCVKLGHYARDCPDRKVSFRATHTVVPGGEDDCSVKSYLSQQGDVISEGAEPADAHGDNSYDPINLEALRPRASHESLVMRTMVMGSILMTLYVKLDWQSIYYCLNLQLLSETSK
jgi:hypothetical protein